MTGTAAGTPPDPLRADRPRRRAWAAALAAVLLVLTWQVSEFTYVSLRTKPARYAPTAPGAVVEGTYGELRLLSWQQSSRWGHGFSEQTGLAEPGTVWVVASLELTLRSHDEDFGCLFTLVGADGGRWSAADPGLAEVEGESCVPDEYELGRSYVFRQGFQVPVDELDQVAGVAEERFTLGRIPLMVPPS